MITLDALFSKVGEYVAATTPQPPLFEYSSKIDRELNANMTSLSSKGVRDLRSIPITQSPFYILNIPFTPSLDVARADAKWNKLTRIIREESFGGTSVASQLVVNQRLMAIIGVNRSTSIDRSDDERFKEWARRINVNGLGFNCRVLTSLWKTCFSVFEGNDGRIKIDHQISQIAFIVLEYLSTEIAAKVKAHLASCSYFRTLIPFMNIREWIKDDMLALQNLEERYKHQSVYMSIMDDDAESFRKEGQGLFSEYDQIVASRNVPPQLMSTGYCAPATASLSTQLAVDVDMHIRQDIAVITQDAPYFPEPNTLVLLNDAAIRAKLSFIAKAQTLDTEGRRFITNIKPALDKSRIAFLYRKCLATEIPERIEASKSLPNFSIKNLGQVGHLKSLKGISQTHADLSILSNNIWLTLQEPKPDMYPFKTISSALYQCYDPIALAKALPRGTGAYNYKCLDFVLTIYEGYVIAVDNRQGDAWAKFAADVAANIWPGKSPAQERYKDAFDVHYNKMLTTYTEAVKKCGEQQAQKVFRLISSAGIAIYKVLKAQVQN